MASFNQVTLLGNLTRDVELKFVGASKTPVAKIGLAVNESVKKGDEWVEEPVFVDVTLWSRNAEIADQYLSKGNPVLISGRLKLETWEKDGEKRSKLVVVGDKLQLLGGKKDVAPKAEKAEKATSGTTSEGGSPPDDGVDIPF